MTQERILKTLTSAFHRNGVPYMLTGSIAVSFYGRPRYTHDVDIVIDVVTESKEALRRALEMLKRQFLTFIDLDNLDDALGPGRMISLLDKKSEMKVDLWIRRDDDFSSASFARRKTKRVFGSSLVFIAPEDLIIQKLLWYKEAKSDRHIEDSYSVYRGQQGLLNEVYLKKWIKRLGLMTNFNRIQAMDNPQR